jgi:hypothetical protein
MSVRGVYIKESFTPSKNSACFPLIVAAVEVCVSPDDVNSVGLLFAVVCVA